MPEEVTTTETSGEEQVAPVIAPEVPEVADGPVQVEFTEESIAAMIDSKDPSKVDLAIKIMAGEEIPLDQLQPKVEGEEATAGGEVPATVEATSDGVPAAEPVAAPVEEKKYYGFEYKGKEAKLEDPDGFLGRGNVDALKKKTANQILYIDELQAKEAAARETASELTRKYNELKAQLETKKSTPPVAAPVAPSHPVAEPVTQVADVIIPEAPQLPDLPADPTMWTEEQADADKKFKRDLLDYNIAVGKAIRIQPTTGGISDELKAEIAELKRQQAEFQATVAEANEKKAIEAQKAQEKQYWESIEEFRNQHKDQYRKSDIHARDLNEKVLSWMDQVADANGVLLPHGATEEQRDQYYRNRGVIVGRYLKNDPEVVNRSQHLDPPQGYDEYFEVAEVMSVKQRLIDEKVLAENATLHDAYIYNMDRNGGFEKGINQIATSSQQKGAKGMVDALTGHHADDAIALPNSTNTQPTISTEMSLAEKQELLGADAREMQRWAAYEPEKLQKREKLLASLGA